MILYITKSSFNIKNTKIIWYYVNMLNMLNIENIII